MLNTVHPTLNDYVSSMRPTCGVHVVWCPFVLEPSTPFSQVLWSMLWPHPQMWLIWSITSNPNSKVLKIEKWKISWNKNKNEKDNKKKLSLLSAILTLMQFNIDIVKINFVITYLIGVA